MVEPTLPLFHRAQAHGDAIAVTDGRGDHAYAELLQAAGAVAAILLAGERDLCEERVAFLVSPGFGYTAALWGIWLAGGIAVPLCVSHPLPELQYVLEDTGATILLADPDFETKLHPLVVNNPVRFLRLDHTLTETPAPLPRVEADRRAMILYTSGTTSKPKGVVTTHANIKAQIRSLVQAWGWTADDRILHVLPLHHVHGIVNVLLCALWAGATCDILPSFDAGIVWERFVGGGLTLFMAVPTIYVKLIAAWESAGEAAQKRMSDSCRGLRLTVSGSAALPVSVFEKWRAVSGHTMLERYGMTEIGMALSNPLVGERRPGFVGRPLPGVTARLVDETGAAISGEGIAGEIQIQGPGVFMEYWRKPEATRAAFRNGWFSTGDVAQVEDGYYRILGRSSVDIIKTGGYKVSALEVEEVLRTHPQIRECAVVGVPDAEWGERVCAAVILSGDDALALEPFREWAKGQLAPYKVPTRLLSVVDLPRNAMGKVTKPAVKELFG
jgi:malonyl-CoA/methylmalonyl-CoA synthetase